MFEGWDAVTLARAQFAFTMSFHIVFPAFSIGLASYLAVLEARWFLAGREVFLNPVQLLAQNLCGRLRHRSSAHRSQCF